MIAGWEEKVMYRCCANTTLGKECILNQGTQHHTSQIYRQPPFRMAVRAAAAAPGLYLPLPDDPELVADEDE